MIPYGKQQINQADIEAVVDVLRSDFLTQGPVVPKFEQAIADRVGAAHAVAVNSGTSALHIACAALDLGPGDWLWTSPITFVASANCGRYCGAEVDFVDIDPDTFNMCPDALERKLAEADRAGTLPKLLVPVHMCGQSPDMESIEKLCRRYGIHIVEDASHAIGASYQDEAVGICRNSDIAVFSFHPVKIITTGEGGLATTNNPELASRMQRLRSHGITRDPDAMVGDSDGPWYYQQVELGWNYRMTEMQAALGLSQLERLETFISKRREIAAEYDQGLADCAIRLPGRQSGADSSWHLYVIRLEDASRRRVVFELLREAGLGVNVHYIPVHLQPDYAKLGFRRGDFPAAEDYYSRAISIPLHPGLDQSERERVVESVQGAVA